MRFTQKPKQDRAFVRRSYAYTDQLKRRHNPAFSQGHGHPDPGNA